MMLKSRRSNPATSIQGQLQPLSLIHIFSFDYTDFDQWIELAIEAGVLDPQTGQGQIKAYSIAPWGNIVTVVDEASGTSRRLTLTPGSDEWQAAWTAFLEDFLRHTVEKGWFDLTYISMDEREMEVLQPLSLIHIFPEGRDRAWVELDGIALRHNLTILRKAMAPQQEIMAVLKANAYGHGLEPTADFLSRQGVRHFAVATVEERCV